MRHYVPALASTVLAVALLTSCTRTTPGNATPGGSISAAPPQPNTGSGAPEVATPLDVSHYQQSPCDALTSAQIDRNLGSGARRTPDTSEPPGCVWGAVGDSTGNISVLFGGDGISRIYDGRGTLFRLFKPFDAIEGYPAAAYGLTDNRMTSGKCTVEVGTSDTSSIDVGVTLFKASVGKKDPCNTAYQIAKLVIGNIKGDN